MMTAGQLHRHWRSLPIGTIGDVIGAGPGLILAPHPDDESLGCGGLIAQCCARGGPPVVAFLTDGAASHPASREYPPARLAALREQEAIAALHILGVSAARALFLREPDGKAPHQGATFDRVVSRLVGCIEQYQCSAILAPWRLDPHCDHAAAARIGAATARSSGVRLVSYPVWGWTLPEHAELEETFLHGCRLEVGAHHREAKRRAIAAHASQYGGVVKDDPAGFRLPEQLLQAMQQPWEVFLWS